MSVDLPSVQKVVEERVARVNEGVARVDAAVATWKATMAKATAYRERTPPNATAVAVELRHAIEALESDLASVLEKRHAARAQADVLEAQATTAVHRGDHLRFRSALLDHEPVIEAIAQLDADADVIRAVVAECAAVLADHS